MQTLIKEPAVGLDNVTIQTVNGPMVITPSSITHSLRSGKPRVDFLSALARLCPNLVGQCQLSDAELAAKAEKGDRRRREGALAKRKAEIQNRWDHFAGKLGNDYRHCRLSTYQLYKAPAVARRQQTALDALTAYAKDMPANIKAGRGIVLLGPSGTGKDHCLAALSRDAILRYGRTVRWARGSAFWIESRCTMGQGEQEFIDSFTWPHILYLSDPLPPIGGLTPHQSAMLYEILDERNRHKRPTWVTMNVCDRTDADSRLGAANVDRLIERALSIQFDWASYRVGGSALLCESS